MAFLKTLGLLFSLLFSTHILADIIKINPNHPDQYTVVKGDTLWDISGQFLENPWQWPEIWEGNPQIKNPHLIYPGDTLYFSIVNGRPRLSLSKDNEIRPRIRETSTDTAITLIPTDAIAQFLTSPRIVNKTELDNSPYIVDFSGEHLVVGAGDRIYVRAIKNPTSLSYTIYRAGETYRDHETNEILGYEAKYIADTTIERAGDPATLKVIKSSGEVLRGDRLMESTQDEFALNFFPHAPKKPIEGHIISVLDGVSQIGQFNVVVLNKGTFDGLETGHILDIYHKGRVITDPFSKQRNATIKLPDEIAGVLMVFRSFGRVSYALVIEATQAIHIYDHVQTP